MNFKTFNEWWRPRILNNKLFYSLLLFFGFLCCHAKDLAKNKTQLNQFNNSTETRFLEKITSTSEQMNSSRNFYNSFVNKFYVLVMENFNEKESFLQLIKIKNKRNLHVKQRNSNFITFSDSDNALLVMVSKYSWNSYVKFKGNYFSLKNINNLLRRNLSHR